MSRAHTWLPVLRSRVKDPVPSSPEIDHEPVAKAERFVVRQIRDYLIEKLHKDFEHMVPPQHREEQAAQVATTTAIGAIMTGLHGTESSQKEIRAGVAKLLNRDEELITKYHPNHLLSYTEQRSNIGKHIVFDAFKNAGEAILEHPNSNVLGIPPEELGEYQDKLTALCQVSVGPGPHGGITEAITILLECLTELYQEFAHPLDNQRPGQVTAAIRDIFSNAKSRLEHHGFYTIPAQPHHLPDHSTATAPNSPAFLPAGLLAPPPGAPINASSTSLHSSINSSISSLTRKSFKLPLFGRKKPGEERSLAKDERNDVEVTGHEHQAFVTTRMAGRYNL